MNAKPDGQQDEEPRKLTGEAAYKAHLESIEKRNMAARKSASDDRSAANQATAVRARRLLHD